MNLTLLLLACLRQDPIPNVGECAEYPDGAYTFGEIGIGTCLAGPAHLAFAGEADDPVLLVSNANPYLTFTGGSLLALPWSEVDLDEGRNLIDELDPHAVDLPNFAGNFAVTGDLGIVTVRFSEDARTRADDDDVWLFDLRDPAVPALSDRGTDGGETVEVEADPIDVAVDETAGLAFVANRTSHTISVLDLREDEVEVVPPWPMAAMRQSPFFDEDGSGSRAALANLDVIDNDALSDDTWDLAWIEGIWRLWVPSEGGIQRTTTTGADYLEAGIGTELAVADTDELLSEVLDPDFELLDSTGAMYFQNEGDIWLATVVDFLGEWALGELPVFEGEDWDATVGGPDLVVGSGSYWLFYDGTDGVDWGIGAALSPDGADFLRVGDPLLVPLYDHEASRISDPYVIYDVMIDRWRMYYSAYDGVRWTLGHATSPDLYTWTQDESPVFSLDESGVDVAAPVVAAQAGLFRMWYARGEGGSWSLAAAESVDGTSWTDLGTVETLDEAVATGAEPPGPGLFAESTDAFQVTGEAAGRLRKVLTPGEDYDNDVFGWSARVVAGYQLSPLDIGEVAWNGVVVDSVDVDAGLAWLTYTDGDGTPSIGVATWGTDNLLSPVFTPVLSASDEQVEAFEADGLSSPVVYMVDGVFHMIYAGVSDDVATLGLATSPDGLVWTRQGQVLDVEVDAWDGAGLLPGSVQALDDGSYRLWYTGDNGDLMRIGTALSTDGQTWTRDPFSESKPWAFPPGAPGEWDDSGVRDPYVLTDADGDHLWYAGSDGDIWRIGYALRPPDDETWTRSLDEGTEETRPVLGQVDSLFHPDGAARPVVLADDEGWTVWFAGLDAGVSRVGLATGGEPDRLHEHVRRPTLGDHLAFSTEKGDENRMSIPLDTLVDNRAIYGDGLSQTLYDEAHGFLFVASTHTNYIFIVDVRDDSASGEPDSNYLDLEGILIAETRSGGAGFRGMAVAGDRLYALNDSPESVMVFDLTAVEDNAVGDVVYDALLATLPAPRGAERDEGENTWTSVGPGALVLDPDGRRMYVSNFNANSVGVYDLDIGTAGELVTEIEEIGENPYALALSPDGKSLVVANYSGEVSEEGEAASTLAVIDTDETSPSYLEVRTWLVNK